MSALVGYLILLYAAGSGCVIVWMLGVKRGRDLQRVEDIQELWRAMPDRDARGRYKHKEKSP